MYIYIDVQMIMCSSTIALGMTRRLEIRNVEEIFGYSCQTLLVDDVKMNLGKIYPNALLQCDII